MTQRERQILNCNYGLWKSHGKQNNCSHPLSLFE